MKVLVYRNLHKKTYSVMYQGRVIAHQDNVRLENAEFVVRKAGYDKVKAGGNKTVHAFVKGDWVPEGPLGVDPQNRLSYNPRTGPPFFTSQGIPAQRAGYAELREQGAYAAYIAYYPHEGGF